MKYIKQLFEFLKHHFSKITNYIWAIFGYSETTVQEIKEKTQTAEEIKQSFDITHSHEGTQSTDITSAQTHIDKTAEESDNENSEASTEYSENETTVDLDGLIVELIELLDKVIRAEKRDTHNYYNREIIEICKKYLKNIENNEYKSNFENIKNLANAKVSNKRITDEFINESTTNMLLLRFVTELIIQKQFKESDSNIIEQLSSGAIMSLIRLVTKHFGEDPKWNTGDEDLNRKIDAYINNQKNALNNLRDPSYKNIFGLALMPIYFAILGNFDKFTTHITEYDQENARSILSLFADKTQVRINDILSMWFKLQRKMAYNETESGEVKIIAQTANNEIDLDKKFKIWTLGQCCIGEDNESIREDKSSFDTILPSNIFTTLALLNKKTDKEKLFDKIHCMPHIKQSTYDDVLLKAATLRKEIAMLNTGQSKFSSIEYDNCKFKFDLMQLHVAQSSSPSPR